MTSRQNTLAALADAFGRCLLANSIRESGGLASPGESKYRRLRRIASLMDRLGRHPSTRTWQRHAERIHREICAIQPPIGRDVRPASLWASA
ncbi:MAG: hypothetical protein ACREKL_12830 [Chthoniobacterales bacterium]